MDYEQFKRYFNISLNKQQEAALTNIEGQTLLLAVPGSGKTTTLVCRVGYMIYVAGIDPSKILVMTFTKAAARDMVERFVSMFGNEYEKQLRFRTINSLCEYILAKYCQIRNRRKPQLLEDNYNLLLKLYQDVYNTYPAENDIKGMQLAITRAKNLQLTEGQISKVQVEGKRLLPLFNAYQKYLNATGQMDYDDQMVFAHSILTNDAQFRSWLQDSNPYILVDEAQDTSRIQHVIIDILASKHKHLFMVGDEDQSIYGFRAAYPDALMEFGRKYPGAQILKLERNYRSTPEIVRLANAFIKQNKNRYQKQMFTERPSGEKVKFLKCKRREDQYNSIAPKLLTRWEGETAVIYRNNESAIPLVAELMKCNMPFRCRGMDTVFFGSRTVIDIKNIMLSAMDPYNFDLFWKTYSLFNAHVSRKATYNATKSLDRNKHASLWYALYYGDDISKNYKQQVKAVADGLASIRKSNKALDAISTIRKIGYKRADDDRAFILSTLAENGETITDFMSRLAELEQAMKNISYNRHIPYVLTTVHSSKGLEYDNVIIMDEISPIFPDNRSDIEEERRLFYVAMTRAKNNLILLSYDNEKQPFIDTIERFCNPKHSSGKNKTSEKPKSSVTGKTGNASQYRIGTRVFHYMFGAGQIINVDKDIVSIRFDKKGIKKLSISICEEQRLVKFL